MRIEQSLNEILKSLDDLPWDHQLYVKDQNLDDVNALALVLNDDDEVERDEDDEPEFATSQGYRYFLSIADLQSISKIWLAKCPLG